MELPVHLRLRRHLMTKLYFAKYYKLFMQSQFYSADELHHIQIQKFKKIAKEAIDYVPFYKSLAKEINFTHFTLDELKKFPIVNKDLMRSRVNDFISGRVNTEKAYWSHTSGSSGKPFHFVLPLDTSDAFEDIVAARAWSMGEHYSYRPNDPIISLRSYAPKTNEPLYRKRNNIWYLSAFDLNKKNLEDYISIISQSKAKLIRGYASSIYIFTLLLEENNVKIDQIQSLVTSSENMLPHFREKIESYWGIKVLDWYGQNERTITVQQCSHGNYHNNDEYGLIELDERNQIIATSLNNNTMPFIRYATGDIAIPLLDGVLKNCPCGRGLSIPFRGIDGRSDDILIKNDGTRVPTANIYTAMQTIEELSQFCITQEKDKSLTITLVGNKELDNEIFNRVRTALTPRVGNLDMNFNVTKEITRNKKTGKIKAVESLISKEEQ